MARRPPDCGDGRGGTGKSGGEDRIHPHRAPREHRRRWRGQWLCLPRARAGGRGSGGGDGSAASARGGDTAIRPERFARLVTLASILIQAGRAGGAGTKSGGPGELGRVKIAEVCERLQLSEEELREDVNVLNVVNFGGGSYVLYAEIKEEEEGRSRWIPEPYRDNFDRPAQPVAGRGQALVAAIDLISEHLPEGRSPPRARRSSQRSARTRWKRVCRSPTPGGDDST